MFNNSTRALVPTTRALARSSRSLTATRALAAGGRALSKSVLGGKGNPYVSSIILAAELAIQVEAAIQTHKEYTEITDTLQEEIDKQEKKDKSDYFMWRTVGDDRVRDEHAALDGKIFSWKDGADGLYPGDAYNCRCIAVPFDKENNRIIE